jgi:IS4 transposase
LARSESLKKTLQSCFPDDWIRETAATTGLVRRNKKIDVVAFFWTLVLGFGTGACRSIAELRRNFEHSTGTELVPSSFYDRFTPTLCGFLKAAVNRACQTVAEPVERLGGSLAQFADVVLADCTVIALHDLLANAYEACRTNHTKAALKLQLVISALAAGPRAVHLLSERGNEIQKLKIGPWVKGRLLLMDLGYYFFSLFERVDRNGGYIVSRAKSNANFPIVGANRLWRGRAADVVGKRLQDVLPLLRREELDVNVEVTVARRQYNGKRSKVTKVFRLVALRNDETNGYHLYLTNIDSESLSPTEIAQAYSARWEIEMLFKELKSQYRIDELPSAKRHIVESLIYVAILTLTISRLLLQAMRRRAFADRWRTPARRWAALFRSIATALLELLLSPHPERRKWRKMESLLCHEFKDPNINRARSPLQAAA